MIVDSALTIINYDTLDQTGKANIDDHEETTNDNCQISTLQQEFPKPSLKWNCGLQLQLVNHGNFGTASNIIINSGILKMSNSLA